MSKTMEWNEYFMIHVDPSLNGTNGINGAKSSSALDTTNKILIKIVSEVEGNKSKQKTIGMVNITLPTATQLSNYKDIIEQWYPINLTKTFDTSNSKDNSLLISIKFPNTQRKHSMDSGLSQEQSQQSQTHPNNVKENSLNKPSTVTSPKLSPKPGEDERLRKGVITELMLTEEQYVKDLGIIIDLFEKPIQSNGWLDPRELATLFSNVEKTTRS